LPGMFSREPSHNPLAVIVLAIGLFFFVLNVRNLLSPPPTEIPLPRLSAVVGMAMGLAFMLPGVAELLPKGRTELAGLLRVGALALALVAVLSILILERLFAPS
jgi:hypothetical protein